MQLFLKNILALFVGSLVIVFVVVIVLQRSELLMHGLENIPGNNTSNSPCFRSKIDHMKKCEPKSDRSTFMIMGSSMALNNISGRLIENRTGDNVYNISSWGIKVRQLDSLYRIRGHKNVTNILFAFNNVDFGPKGIVLNYKNIRCCLDDHFPDAVIAYASVFNFHTFLEDWDFRARNGKRENMYETIHFDSTGSVLLKRQNFIINPARWSMNYDTVGFSEFLYGAKYLAAYCALDSVRVCFVYLPTRADLVTPTLRKQIDGVSLAMRREFGPNFIDLSNKKISDTMYCDGLHFFSEGANLLTGMVIDSLEHRHYVGN